MNFHTYRLKTLMLESWYEIHEFRTGKEDDQ